MGDTTKGLEQQEKIRGLESQSHENDELLPNVPFTTDEVSREVAKLKKRKAPGPDGLMTEHLKKSWRRICCDLADDDSQ